MRHAHSPKVAGPFDRRLGVAAADLAASFVGKDLFQRVASAAERVEGEVVFTTSFGIEDQAISHAILSQGLDIEIVTLDTGRLFPETLRVWAETETRYGVTIRAHSPRHDALEALGKRQGVDGIYLSVANRKDCCTVRKIEPLARALDGASGWITGLRGDQSAQRAGVEPAAVDAERGLLKINPLFDWTRDAVVAFTALHEVPVNALHARGFLSIGCAPCTRAVASGEPERAGRWWWEEEAAKECGLHVGPDGRLVCAKELSA
ncbi:phosphoadenylyl-sulfate reductase [Alsobacter sp. SYSU M60028]|uniref:Adenosine 5'-phosphosulfate reductase n=1 Tax=Alsobacter ponti TaxID=2962936 RepID=A0ABT1LET4_9HYPH|nr:phosphoadenylyl-sulfate reductase [Alsobacter ponti]MCP8940020.1 phosphoadenylyl-sulfate reductase [Alsobacter ponti]